MIPLSIPNLSESEETEVLKTLREGWASTAGPSVKEFEAAIAEYCGVRFAVSTNSGTAALHLALQVAGVRPNDLVLVPDLTFIASVNPIAYLGAEPILVDANPKSWQMDLKLVEDFLVNECRVEENQCIHVKSGKIVRAVMPVHVLGFMADPLPWQNLCEAFKLTLIEDAAEALGSRYRGKHAGSFGKISALSFNGNKILTTGGGGMVLTNEKHWAEKVRHLANQAKRHPDEYLHDARGYNYGMTALSAALGIAQLKRLPQFLGRKAKIDARYREAFSDLDGVSLPPNAGPEGEANNWLFTIRTAAARPLEEFLFSRHIHSRKLWVPVHLQGIYGEALFLQKENHSTKIYEESLSLPSSSGLSREDQEKVIEAILDFFA